VRLEMITAITSYDIPSEFQLPFGYVVRVEQSSDRKVAKECGKNAEACWDTTRQLIIIRRQLDNIEKAEIFAHEMLHAVADWERYVRHLLAPE
jgi:hypothetical protein